MTPTHFGGPWISGLAAALFLATPSAAAQEGSAEPASDGVAQPQNYGAKFTVPARPVIPPLGDATASTYPCGNDGWRMEVEAHDLVGRAANQRLDIAVAHGKVLTQLSAQATASRAEFDSLVAINTESRAYQVVIQEIYQDTQRAASARAAVVARGAIPCPAPAAQAEAAPATMTPVAVHSAAPAPAPRETAALPPRKGKPCPPRRNSTVRQPITVGSNGKVGSGARAKGKALGMLGGLAGGLLGRRGGGGGGGASGPQVARCKIKDSEKTLFTDPITGTTLKVGAKRAGETVVVFADIGKSSDKGTFQGGWMETPEGSYFGPHKADICSLWGEWKLTVSWTRTTYVNNQVVSRESGGFSKGGLFSLPGMISTDAAPAGLWQELGFSNAQAGARGVALQYMVPAVELAQTPMTLVIHVTQPSKNPVTTVPFVLTMTEGPDGIVFIQAPAEDEQACPPDEGLDEPELMAEANPREGPAAPGTSPPRPLDETIVDVGGRTFAAPAPGPSTPSPEMPLEGRDDVAVEAPGNTPFPIGGGVALRTRPAVGDGSPCEPLSAQLEVTDQVPPEGDCPPPTPVAGVAVPPAPAAPPATSGIAIPGGARFGLSTEPAPDGAPPALTMQFRFCLDGNADNFVLSDRIRVACTPDGPEVPEPGTLVIRPCEAGAPGEDDLRLVCVPETAAEKLERQPVAYLCPEQNLTLPGPGAYRLCSPSASEFGTERRAIVRCETEEQARAEYYRSLGVSEFSRPLCVLTPAETKLMGVGSGVHPADLPPTAPRAEPPVGEGDVVPAGPDQGGASTGDTTGVIFRDPVAPAPPAPPGAVDGGAPPSQPLRDKPLEDPGDVFFGQPDPDPKPTPRYFTVERAPPIRYHSVERDAPGGGATLEIDASACARGAASATPAGSTVNVGCAPTPGATKAELVVCGEAGTMADRARLCITEPVPGAIKGFTFPHVLDLADTTQSGKFEFDTTFMVTYSPGLAGPPNAGCGNNDDLFLFEFTGGKAVVSTPSPSAPKLLPVCIGGLPVDAASGEGLLVPFGPDFGGASTAGTVSRGFETDAMAADLGIRFSW